MPHTWLSTFHTHVVVVLLWHRRERECPVVRLCLFQIASHTLNVIRMSSGGAGLTLDGRPIPISYARECVPALLCIVRCRRHITHTHVAKQLSRCALTVCAAAS